MISLVQDLFIGFTHSGDEANAATQKGPPLPKLPRSFNHLNMGEVSSGKYQPQLGMADEVKLIRGP